MKLWRTQEASIISLCINRIIRFGTTHVFFADLEQAAGFVLTEIMLENATTFEESNHGS
jgi:hypothetical protein